MFLLDNQTHVLSNYSFVTTVSMENCTIVAGKMTGKIAFIPVSEFYKSEKSKMLKVLIWLVSKTLFISNVWNDFFPNILFGSFTVVMGKKHCFLIHFDLCIRMSTVQEIQTELWVWLFPGNKISSKRLQVWFHPLNLRRKLVRIRWTSFGSLCYNFDSPKIAKTGF